MRSRWSILALLFAVRTTMAVQFQSFAALAPLIQREFSVGLADLGLAIGLYLAPGVVLAMPGGDIGRRFGDKAVVVAGLALMLCGGLMMALSPSWDFQLLGRLLAGTGGVLLNVLMSKMVTDWFAGREIATALGIFVNSWPFGIALALLVLPAVGTAYGVSAAALSCTALIAIGLLAMAVFYRAPATQGAGGADAAWPQASVVAALLPAAALWGLYNGAIAMIFAFGPTMLAERGWSLGEASSATSVVLWVAVLSVPIGGVIADRSGRHQVILVGSCIVFAALLLLATRSDAVLPMFVALGFVSGLAAGPIMSLPARVLASEARATGMGIFYTIFYAFVVLAPWIAGLLANAAASARITFDFGAAMLLLCCLCLWAYRRAAGRISTRMPMPHARAR